MSLGKPSIGWRICLLVVHTRVITSQSVQIENLQKIDFAHFLCKSTLWGVIQETRIFLLGPIFWVLQGFEILTPGGTPKTLKSHISANFHNKRAILVSIFLF